jgi:hypothetical protein
MTGGVWRRRGIRNRGWGVSAIALFILLLSACFPSTPLPPSPTPTLSPTRISPTPLPPTLTPVPTLDPAGVAATIAAGEARVATGGVEPLCLRREDSDGDGEMEWIGLYLRPTDPAQLIGFVLDGETWHDLRPQEGSEEAEVGLGEYPTCELEVRDLNADGRVELAIWGHAGISTDLLHIFTWDETRYALLGAFEGGGGVRLEKAGLALADEVVVRLWPEGDLVWEIVYTWDGTNYAWTWDRYAWFYLARPHALVDDSPLHTLASFYLALDDRDLPGAYALLSPAYQASYPYDGWVLGFATTMAVEVGAARLVSQEGGRATVAAQVRALDNVDSRIIATLYALEWQMVETEVGWRLENGSAELLDQWEVPYYP